MRNRIVFATKKFYWMICYVFAFTCFSGCCDQSKIPALTSQLQSTKTRERTDAALALARCGGKADRAVSSLAKLLYDDNAGVQSAASYALRQINTESAQEVIRKIDLVRKTQKRTK
jgi:hypothetical protein